jgi:hypothetical protein
VEWTTESGNRDGRGKTKLLRSMTAKRTVKGREWWDLACELNGQRVTMWWTISNNFWNFCRPYYEWKFMLLWHCVIFVVHNVIKAILNSFINSMKWTPCGHSLQNFKCGVLQRWFHWVGCILYAFLLISLIFK